MSTNGRLSLPPYPKNSPTQIYNITIFLSSYDTGRNFTITNGTASANNASLGDIMLSEPGSTVKHVKWVWPDCLVGDGSQGNGIGKTDRGVYNVPLPPPPSPLYISLTDQRHHRSQSANPSASTAKTTTPSSTCPSRSPTASRRARTGRRATPSTTRC